MAGAETAFDIYASGYDADFSASRTGKMQRDRVWKFLSAFSPAASPDVLELNGGTGEDATWFSQKGFRIVSTDLSAAMVETTQKKLAAAGLKGETIKADLRAVPQQFTGRKFDLVFSDFGGLNCLSPDELRTFAGEIKTLLKPNGQLAFVIMGRNCRWERFYFKRKKKTAEANRRRSKEPVTASIGGQNFPVWYYSPEEFYAFFEKEFSIVRKKPVGLFIPPSYLESWFVKRPVLLSFLGFLEKLFPFSFCSDLADHYYLEMKSRAI